MAFKTPGRVSSDVSSTTSQTEATTTTSASGARAVADNSQGLDAALRRAHVRTMQRTVGRKQRDAATRSQTPPPKRSSNVSPRHQMNVETKFKPSKEAKMKLHHAIADSMDAEVDLDNVVHFCFWAKDIMRVLYDLFKQPDSTGNYIRCRPVPVEEFVGYCARNGFDGDPVSVVREIYKCAPPGVIQMLNQSSVGGTDYEITMPMLQRFIRTYEHETAGLAWSPLNEFKKTLVEKRGCLLRAWRLDIDLYNTGTVAFSTFITACHKQQVGHVSQGIWQAMRPDNDQRPLEFSEFAPEEAANLDKFTDSLWVAYDFNMYKAWEHIDVTERLWVTEAELVDAAKKIGFTGDASLLYKGLDTYGFGRLWRRELEYLKILFNATSRTAHGAPEMHILQVWAAEQFKSVDGFLARLGLERADGTFTEVMLKEGELASALEQLGFPGESAKTAHLVGRAAGGPDEITGELLDSLLTSSRPAVPVHMSRTKHGRQVQLKGVNPRARSLPPKERPKWNDSVDDISDRNENNPTTHRYYFTNPKTLVYGEHKQMPPPPRRKYVPPPEAAPINFQVRPPREVDESEKKSKKKDKKDRDDDTEGATTTEDDEGKDKKEKKKKKKKDKKHKDDGDQSGTEDEDKKEKKKKKKEKKQKKDKKSKKDDDEDDEAEANEDGNEDGIDLSALAVGDQSY